MSLIFIDEVVTYRAVINKKCSELETYVAANFSHVLTDHKGLIHLDEEIRSKIAELETKYPKSKPILCDSNLSSVSGWITAYPEHNPDKTIFRLTYHAVIADYFPRGVDQQYRRQPIQEGGDK